MRAGFSFVLLAVGLLATASVYCAAEEEAVTVLTASNFDDTLKNTEIVLVKFYAPWCGHCKRMAPEYEKAAKILKEKGSKIMLAKVDATSETDIADKQGVREYPTLTLFRNQKPEKFTGGRTAEAIVEWIEKMTGPAVTEVEGKPEEQVTKESPIAFVAELSSKDSDMAKLFEDVANESRQLGKFLAKYGVSDEKIYSLRYEEGTEPFTGKTKDELKKFVDTESFPLLGPINAENFRKYIDRDLDLVWLCGTEKDFDEAKAAVREAAKKLRDTRSFVWLDTDQFKGHAENALGITEFPGLVFQSKKGRFVLPEATSSLKDAAKISKFFEDVDAGKIERSLKSEPVPEKQDEAVKVVVGKNFEEMVIQKDKDVMLEIYAPWCGYCKSFEPIYKEFAEKYKDVDHLVVAKMDGTANEAPLEEFSWSSFPSIFFVKAGEKTPMKFEGSRTVEGLTEFINKHGSKPLKKDDKGEEL
ncbi:protein disulfide isomerase [Neospora caninum Liverpool]|uniref:Protein disulfide-isomerase n=2 Tax=Neospora caninum TaxID=29176 RepID=PDI_NEOCL|nr:protein disulfide isomerase [Neospora caninum Liverpool]AAV34741.1 protein disulfide isomerase precursor [Neospora caninum]BAD67151.2 protein disulfide isomerase [Neospora caninum]CBZ50675.1 protein disulfide isomerase [Neospora caninum Liverpool]CEL65286.1 TPA: protein disulfide isomerase [Neospora caninum Liverpool]|eukprot:XP_003880708.1 protein disulfide isomerase [Neospora caninum Liverpool]